MCEKKDTFCVHFEVFLFYIISVLLFSQQGESYTRQEKSVKNHDKSEFTINTLVL